MWTFILFSNFVYLFNQSGYTMHIAQPDARESLFILQNTTNFIGSQTACNVK